MSGLWNSSRLKNILLLGITSFFTDISSEMIYPILPLFLTQTLGAPITLLGVIEGVAESIASLTKVLSGYVSDQLGRRKPLAMVGYGLSALSKAVFVTAHTPLAVLLGRVFDRFGKGIRQAPRDALIADFTEPAHRGQAYGLHRAMDTAGAFVGVGLAYLIISRYRGDFREVFAWALIPGVLSLAVLVLVRDRPLNIGVRGTAFGVPSLQAPPLQGLVRSWYALNPRLRYFLMISFLFTLGNSSEHFLILKASKSGVSESNILLLYLLFNASSALASYPAGQLSDRLGRQRLLVIGYLLYGSIYLGFARAGHSNAFWWLFIAYGVYYGLATGVEKALVADLAPLHQRASLAGLHATIVGIGLLPASVLAGILWDWLGMNAPFYFGCVTGFLAAWLIKRL